jgi:hypothetical protein
MSTADTTSSDSPKTMRRATWLALVAAIAVAGWAATVAAAESECRALFDGLDTNHDGVVDPTEFATNKVAVAFMNAEQNSSVVPFARTHLSRRAFDELDLNHDGVLDAHDIANAPFFQFHWWDRNDDNIIGWNEFQARCQELER